MGDDWGSGRNNQNDMSSNGNCKSPANGLVSSKVGICNICAEEWHKVDPELIECSNSSRSSLLEVQGTGLAIVTSSCARAIGERLLDEVGDWQLSIDYFSDGEDILTYKLPWFHNTRNVRTVPRRRAQMPSMELCPRLDEVYATLPQLATRQDHCHSNWCHRVHVGEGEEVRWACLRTRGGVLWHGPCSLEGEQEMGQALRPWQHHRYW